MKYFLYENKMTPNPDVCVAKVTQLEITRYDELVKKTTRRGITVTDTELKAAIDELVYTIIEELSQGRAVETPFARYKPSICGVFKNKDDVFDSLRHTYKINCSAGKAIKIDVGTIPIEKIKHVVAGPYIDNILDYSSQEENSMITKGGAVEVSGELLKIDTTDPEQGLFFIQNGTSVKVDMIFRNFPSDLIFNIPANIADGEYQLEIRNKTNKNDKNLKTYLFPNLLTVR